MSAEQAFLIVESEFLIALDIQRVLESVDARQCVLATSPAEARAMALDSRNFALAVLEFRSGDTHTLALARDLATVGVPLVLLVSEVGLRQGVPALPGAPVVIKPFLEEDLASAVRQALAG